MSRLLSIYPCCKMWEALWTSSVYDLSILIKPKLLIESVPLPWLIFIVTVMRFRITSGCVYQVIALGSSTIFVGGSSMCWDSRLNKEKKVNWAAWSIPLFFLTEDAICPTAHAPTSYLPTKVDCVPFDCEPKQTLWSCSCQVFVTAMRKVTALDSSSPFQSPEAPVIQEDFLGKQVQQSCPLCPASLVIFTPLPSKYVLAGPAGDTSPCLLLCDRPPWSHSWHIYVQMTNLSL